MLLLFQEHEKYVIYLLTQLNQLFILKKGILLVVFESHQSIISFDSERKVRESEHFLLAVVR